MIITLLKLSFAGFRSRILVNMLTAVLCMASAATIVLTLNVRETVAAPWDKTFEAAHGAHVLIMTTSQPNARTAATLPDIAEVDEPAPFVNTSMVNTSMTVEGQPIIATLIGLTEWPTINIPLLTDGERLHGDGIVLERSFARTLRARIGSSRGVHNGRWHAPFARHWHCGLSKPIALSPANPRTRMGHGNKPEPNRTRSEPLALAGGHSIGRSRIDFSICRQREAGVCFNPVGYLHMARLPF